MVRHNIVRGKLDLPKGRTEDEVGLTSRLVAALKTFRHDDGPFVLTNKHGVHFSEQDPKAWMEKITRLANVPWHGTHVLRKTCGSRIADGGGGVAAVAAHLRHKDLQTAPARSTRWRSDGGVITPASKLAKLQPELARPSLFDAVDRGVPAAAVGHALAEAGP